MARHHQPTASLSLQERLAEQLEELTTELSDSLLDEELSRIVESNRSHTFEVVDLMRETYQEQLRESDDSKPREVHKTCAQVLRCWLRPKA